MDWFKDDEKVIVEEIWDRDTVYFVPNLHDPERDDVYEFLDEVSDEIDKYEVGKDFQIGIPPQLGEVDSDLFEEIYDNYLNYLDGEARKFHKMGYGLGKGQNLGEYVVGAIGGVAGGGVGVGLAEEELAYVLAALGTAVGVGGGIKLTKKMKNHFQGRSKEIRDKRSNLKKLKLERDFEEIER